MRSYIYLRPKETQRILPTRANYKIRSLSISVSQYLYLSLCMRSCCPTFVHSVSPCISYAICTCVYVRESAKDSGEREGNGGGGHKDLRGRTQQLRRKVIERGRRGNTTNQTRVYAYWPPPPPPPPYPLHHYANIFNIVFICKVTK